MKSVTIAIARSQFDTGLPYVAIHSKNALDFSFFFLCRKTQKLRNRIFPIAPLVSIVPVPCLHRCNETGKLVFATDSKYAVCCDEKRMEKVFWRFCAFMIMFKSCHDV